MEHLTLYYRQGSSDKVYQASLEPADGGYVVRFAYGRRGTTLQTGTKTPMPVSYDEASHWCAHPTTVIHAPQQMRHFEILVSELGCGVGMPNIAGMAWWRLAWNEIRRTRGEASQAGMQEHEIVEEQMIAVLRELLPQIRAKASANTGFNLEIPPGSAMQGAFLFFKISGVEEGFLAPEAELKIVRELNTLEQWRV